MKSLFVCLANSKKYGERCIAGIELKREGNGDLTLVRLNGKPKWLRPVSNSEHGEVNANLVNHIKLNDIVEIDILEECPNGYQSENVLFGVDSLKVISSITLSSQNLDKLITVQGNLFGNRGKAVAEEQISSIKHSLTLIKVETPELYIRTDFGKNQLRLKFRYNNSEYDLPITDIGFEEKYDADKDVLAKASNIYLTISLGVAYEGWYYKLIAGVIYL